MSTQNIISIIAIIIMACIISSLKESISDLNKKYDQDTAHNFTSGKTNGYVIGQIDALNNIHSVGRFMDSTTNKIYYLDTTHLIFNWYFEDQIYKVDSLGQVTEFTKFRKRFLCDE